MKLATVLRDARKGRELTQAETARRAGISRPTYNVAKLIEDLERPERTAVEQAPSGQQPGTTRSARR